MPRHFLFSLLAVFVLSFTSNAHSADDAIVILKADHWFNVAEGKLQGPVTLVIAGNHIQKINPETLPKGARIVELGDHTLMPGFIDVHTHLTMDYIGDRWETAPVKETVADWALFGVPSAEATLMAGFTTVRDVGSWRDMPDVALMRAIDRGVVPGPRIIASGHMLSITGGHCDITGFAPGIMPEHPYYGVADGVDEIVKAVRYQIKHGAKVIKICATAGVYSFEDTVGAQQFTEEEMRAAVEEAARHGLKVAAHAHGAEGMYAAVKAGVASIEHGSILTKETARLMKKLGTYYVPNMHLLDATDLDVLPPEIRKKDEFLRPFIFESLKLAIDMKLNMALGTDATIFPHGDNGKEFHALVKNGQTPLEAIRMGTMYAADLLGTDDRGRIAEGLLADIVAVRGNPLDDVRILENVVFVMKNGVVYKSP